MLSSTRVALGRAMKRFKELPEWAQDLLLALSLFLAALVIRLPYLMLVPLFSDETVEVLRSLQVSQGKLFPLTNADPYYGAIYNYLIAGVFYVFGPTADNARLTVTVLGALTVPLTYFLGKALDDRLTGLITALMMLTSVTHIVNAHIAWENMMTPFFTTAAFLIFTLALKQGSGKLLVVSGLLYGVSLQTHPSVILVAPGLALTFLYAGLFHRKSDRSRSLWSWIRSPWPYVALIAVAIGDGNVILQNIQQPWSSWIAAQRHTYAYEPNPTLDTYLTNLQNFGVLVLRVLSSSIDGRPTPLDYLLVPLNALALVLLLIGTGYAAKHGKMLAVIVLATALLTMPYFNKSYGFPGAARYVGYLLPLIYLLAAAPLAQAVRIGLRSRGMHAVYLGLLGAFLIVSPALSLTIYYGNADRSGSTNAQVLSVYQGLRQQYLSGTISQVIIDEKLKDVPQGGGGNIQRTLDYLFILDKTPHRTLGMAPEGLKGELRKNPASALALVLASDSYDSLSKKMRLTTVEVNAGSSIAKTTKYGIYVLEPASIALDEGKR